MLENTPELRPETRVGDRHISRQEFEDWYKMQVNLRSGTAKDERRNINSAWEAGQKINDLLWPMSETDIDDKEHDLDLYPVLSCFKWIILGAVKLDINLGGLGRRSWRVLADLLKERFPDDPDIVAFEWRDGIHNRFTNDLLAVRMEASQELYDLHPPESAPNLAEQLGS